MTRTNRWAATLLTAAVSLGYIADARAELEDRGWYDGVRLIYDSTQHITWLGDANWAKTSGFDADGEMTWEEASAWARGLTIGGNSDWRLPLTFDETCRGTADCTNSEMGHLFTVDGVSSSTNAGLFVNVEAHQYWSRRSYSSDRDLAWHVHFGNGTQAVAGKNDRYIPWAVLNGDVGAEVSITPKTGSFPNRANLGLRGPTRVAVLNSALQNVDDMEVSILTLGMLELETVGKTDRAFHSRRDVSGDFAALDKNGGEGGIRTHVPVTRQDAFEAPPLRPLRYLSVYRPNFHHTLMRLLPSTPSDVKRRKLASTSGILTPARHQSLSRGG